MEVAGRERQGSLAGQFMRPSVAPPWTKSEKGHGSEGVLPSMEGYSLQETG